MDAGIEMWLVWDCITADLFCLQLLVKEDLLTEYNYYDTINCYIRYKKKVVQHYGTENQTLSFFV